MIDLNQINYAGYDSVRCGYDHLADNDPSTAWKIMKAASGELEYFESLVAEAEKIVIETEKLAKGTEAQTSYGIDSNHVSKGERQAKFHPDTLRAWNEYAMAVKIKGLLSAQARNLNRIYFDCKTIVEIGNSKSRGGRYSE